MNLGWKLAAHLRGHPGVLDTYHAERHPVGAHSAPPPVRRGTPAAVA